MKIFKVMMLVFGAMFFPLIASAEGLPANPWLTHANKGVVLDFQRKLEGLNPGVRFCLLHLEQISLLNELGKNQDFEILNCWTQSTYDDWHGRVDGYYSLTNGGTVIDWGENETDVYFVFGFVPGQENNIIVP